MDGLNYVAPKMPGAGGNFRGLEEDPKETLDGIMMKLSRLQRGDVYFE